jgi:hypothetical protein
MTIFEGDFDLVPWAASSGHELVSGNALPGAGRGGESPIKVA